MAATCTSLQSRPRGLRIPRTVRARATPRRLLTPLSCLATDLDGRFPGCGEAGTTELDAAGLAAAKAAGLGALADCCPLVLRQRDVTARGWPDGGGEVSGGGPAPRLGDAIAVFAHERARPPCPRPSRPWRSTRPRRPSACAVCRTGRRVGRPPPQRWG